MPEKRVVIVGAGLSGLACALRLQERGINCHVLEKSTTVGGRVNTHRIDGFRLDQGFQVLLTAYPRTRQILDYKALELKTFHPGALIRHHGKFHLLGDPTRRPFDALSTLLAPIGNLSDKTRMLQVREKVLAGTVSQLMERPEVTTLERLREYGFSYKMVNQFFRPFLGGIFLESNLVTSSRKFEFVMRMFSQGEAALPKFGMHAIPRQMADRLEPGVLRLQSEVASISEQTVTLQSGERLPADVVVLATSQLEAAKLQSDPQSVRSTAVTCLYFVAAKSPVRGPWLVLNGEGAGPINNLCVPTEVHATYAPDGKSLISVTVLGLSDNEEKLLAQVRAQLIDWYGNAASTWRHLQTYCIPAALTLQEPPALEPLKKPVKISDTLFVCGDYLSITSIEGAISSGIRCADAL